jgi:hypothetical protein
MLILTVGADPADLVNPFDDLHDSIIPPFDDIASLLRDPPELLSTIRKFELQEPFAEYVMGPKFCFFHSASASRTNPWVILKASLSRMRLLKRTSPIAFSICRRSIPYLLLQDPSPPFASQWPWPPAHTNRPPSPSVALSSFPCFGTQS